MHIYPLTALFGGVVCLFILFVCLSCFFILLILILHCLLLQTFRRPQFRVKDGKRVSRSVCLLACLFVRSITIFAMIQIQIHSAHIYIYIYIMHIYIARICVYIYIIYIYIMHIYVARICIYIYRTCMGCVKRDLHGMCQA